MELKIFRKLLKKNGHFNTAPRYKLFITLQEHPAITMAELISLLPSQDTATVYRNVDLFEKLGIINRLRLGWRTKIELSDIFRHHHHHFTCVKCSKVYDLPDNKQLEKQITTLTAGRHFKPMDHQLEIRGFCKSCKNFSN